MEHSWDRHVGVFAKILHSRNFGFGFKAGHESSCDSGYEFCRIDKSHQICLEIMMLVLEKKINLSHIARANLVKGS